MFKRFVLELYSSFIGVLLGALVRMIPKKHALLIWGPTPILNNKYWSVAVKGLGYESITLMQTFYPSINKRTDFDMYFGDCVPKWIAPGFLRKFFLSYKRYFAFFYIIRNARVLHLPFSGGPLGKKSYWRIEAGLYRKAGIKLVLIPYGADAYVYSRVMDPSARNGLLISYPEAARNEARIRRQVEHWTRHADIVISGLMIDGMGRWDCPVFNPICIDTTQWTPKEDYSGSDGGDGVVRVLHTPNHRGAKGTEFLVQAVEELREEGLNVELVMVEKVPNDQVRILMQEVDILAEQHILIGYALSAIEGMASGLPVMSNLENKVYTQVFRRYSYLDECPILSSSPEIIKENLRLLVKDPGLRRRLGRAGREYVEKYHSYRTAQYLFGSIYDKILKGKSVDLMNLFHPLKSSYNSERSQVRHGLVCNRILTMAE
jgi:hypothetical protein